MQKRQRLTKRSVSSKCRLCKSAEDSVSHIVCEFSALAQGEYKGRHDGVAKAGHWCLCRKHGLDVTDKWYEHVPGKVRESEKVKILWDFSIQTNHSLNTIDLI